LFVVVSRWWKELCGGGIASDDDVARVALAPIGSHQIERSGKAKEAHQDQCVDGPIVTQIAAPVSDGDRKSRSRSDQGNHGGNCTETLFHHATPRLNLSGSSVTVLIRLGI